MTAAAEAPDARGWKAATDVLSILGPLSAVTGLLYYFGRARAQSYYGYFGVDLSVLGVTPFDFLIGTADTVFRPTAVGLVAAVGLLAAYPYLRSRLQRVSATWRARARLLVLGLSAVVAAFAVTGLYLSLPRIAAALCLVVAGVLLEVGLRSAGSASLVRLGLVVCVAVVGLFWAVSVLAHDRGAEDARLFEQRLPLDPQAVVYSAKDLQLIGPYVGSTRLAGPDSAYRFRYNGLRQLTYGNGRWFLLPAGWRRDNGATVIVIHDDPASVRVDLAPGTVLR
ncbi:hypothetical protein [Actinoplanes sp. URMC 104]|uniref:hypothetical protein n=1 Tax=Actinoplanes sp. URMC 104 TaxID=3423409 RepID=UPI003F1C1DA4